MTIRKNKEKQEPTRSKNTIILGERAILKPDRNVLVTGFTRREFENHIVKPNIMQAKESMIINDPTGELYKNYTKHLKENKYNVKLLSTTSCKYSNEYNPMDHLKGADGDLDDAAVEAMAHALIRSYTFDNTVDMVLIGYTQSLLLACIYMVLDFYPEPMRNLVEVASLIKDSFITEDTYGVRSVLSDKLCEARKVRPRSACFRHYDAYVIAGKRMCAQASRLAMYIMAPFDQKPFRDIIRTSYWLAAVNLEEEVLRFRTDDNKNPVKTDRNIAFDNTAPSAIFVNVPETGNAQYDGTGRFLRTIIMQQAIVYKCSKDGEEQKPIVIFADFKDIAGISEITKCDSNGACIITGYKSKKGLSKEERRVKDEFASRVWYFDFDDSETIETDGVDIEDEPCKRESHPSFKNTGEADIKKTANPKENGTCKNKDISVKVKSGMHKQYLDSITPESLKHKEDVPILARRPNTKSDSKYKVDNDAFLELFENIQTEEADKDQ